VNAQGFSLLETMVALAVFSVAAMGLVSLNTQSARISGELDTRLLARTVAENVAVDTVTAEALDLRPVTQGEAIQRGRTYTWTRALEATPQTGLYSIRIDVRESGQAQVLARLSLLATDSAAP
jgi:general secretion pathway protein I